MSASGRWPSALSVSYPSCGVGRPRSCAVATYCRTFCLEQMGAGDDEAGLGAPRRADRSSQTAASRSPTPQSAATMDAVQQRGGETVGASGRMPVRSDDAQQEPAMARGAQAPEAGSERQRRQPLLSAGRVGGRFAARERTAPPWTGRSDQQPLLEVIAESLRRPPRTAARRRRPPPHTVAQRPSTALQLHALTSAACGSAFVLADALPISQLAEKRPAAVAPTCAATSRGVGSVY